MDDMGWHGRIPLFRLIGENVLPIGFFAAGSPADLFCVSKSSRSYTMDFEKKQCAPPFCLARNDLAVHA